MSNQVTRRAAGIKRPEPLSPKEVAAARLLPYEIKERWGYDRSCSPECLPEQVRHEIAAAQKAYAESEARGTHREDYPQLWSRPHPSADLVGIDGLTVHGWQL